MDMLNKIRYIFTRDQKIKFIILFCILLVGAMLEFLGVSIILPFVQVVMEPKQVEENPFLNFLYQTMNMKTVNEFLFFLCIILISIYIIKNIYLVCMKSLQYRFIYHNQLRLSSRLMECYMKKPYTFHLQKNTAEIVRSVTTDVNQLFEMVLTCMLLISDVLITVMLGVFLFFMDPFITVVVVMLLGMSSLFYFVIVRKKLEKLGKQSQKYNGGMIKSIHQALGGIKDIKILKREQYFIDSYLNNGSSYVESNRKAKVLQEIPRYFIETVCVGGVLAVVALKLYEGVELSQVVPQLSVFAIAAFRLLPSVNQINNRVNYIIFLKPSIDLIYKDLLETEDNLRRNKKERRKEREEELEREKLWKKGTEEASEIVMKHVTYTYPNTNQAILKEASLTIPLGTSVGFVGSSGSGKTTTVDLLLGILKPDSGWIGMGNCSVHEFTRQWADKLGYIPQTIYLSDDTIRKNIAFGIGEGEIKEEKVWQAVEAAQLKEFIKGLEQGLDTIIGERGVRLSGGQRQRIGIARALYHNPEILVLDEATSALDNETEALVMEAVERLKGKKTLIIIAHRLTTIKNCNQVFQVKKGRIEKCKNLE